MRHPVWRFVHRDRSAAKSPWFLTVAYELSWGPARGGPRSLVGILKCLVSAFCQGFTSLSEIERHTFVLVVILIKWQTALCAIFSPPPGSHDGGLLFFLRLLTFPPFSDFSFYETFSSRSLIYPCILCHSRSSSYIVFPWPKNITDQKITKIDATDHRSTREGKHKLKWSQIAPMSSIRDRQSRSQDLPGPLPICVRHAILTALRTEDIWHIFCFSCPFMSFEARRKSQYAKRAKLLQFFVANFRLWSRCRHFLIEWPSFVAISFGRCRYFLAHVTCRNLPCQGVSVTRVAQGATLIQK